MEWVTLREAAKILGKSERTLRHHAALGKIDVKKEGREWRCRIARKAPVVPQPSRETTSDNKGERKKIRTLGQLGAYSHLKRYLKKYSAAAVSKPILQDTLIEAMENIALGFYSFYLPEKVSYFKEARRNIVLFFVQIDYAENGEMDDFRNELENELIPGVSGLIRKLEKRT